MRCNPFKRNKWRGLTPEQVAEIEQIEREKEDPHERLCSNGHPLGPQHRHEGLMCYWETS